MPSPFPQPAPTIAGANLTVSVFLRTPARVQRAIEALSTQRFVADVIFNNGPAATGGAVVYDQVVTSDLFLSRDVQEIAPGSEFPILSGVEPTPLVAIARKYGGEVFLTDEAVRRDNRQVLNREMTRLRNTILRKTDTVAMAALDAAPTGTTAASGDWSTPATDIVADIANAVTQITSLDMGYDMPDTAFINPAQELDLLKDKDIRDALPRESTTVPIATGRLGRLLGIDFVVSNRVVAGRVYVMQRGLPGGISDEVPIYARPIADERKEATFVHGARVVTPYVTDPKAVFVITGA